MVQLLFRFHVQSLSVGKYYTHLATGKTGLQRAFLLVAPFTANEHFFKKQNLEDMSPFCGATDTPVFGLLMMSPLGFKAKVGSLICTWWRHTFYTFSEIHLWCDTC